MNLAILGPVIKEAGTAIDKIFTSDDERNQAKIAMKELDLAIDKGQIEINKTEAAHKSIFVAGWRPFIGWVCGCALAYHFILHPIVEAFVDIPDIDAGMLMHLVLAMLGMGGMRTYEKMRGVSREK